MMSDSDTENETQEPEESNDGLVDRLKRLVGRK